ncbi:helix-turn-helix domain-containing protein [Sphingomonas sp. S17]|uniref:helix-turn-helix domain-containing protein n=1 Tax=Sphingomonas sp. S17 TaxID=1007104 RepID=UPI000568B53F|nr:helix-turn-helix transcriptional regulator [Sphingomonas sp. S17]
MATLGVNQATLIEKTGLSKTAISLLVNDRQDYTPEIIRDVADALNIKRYELLMDPEDAMNLRALRNDALRVVQHAQALTQREEKNGQRTGTDG